uniref:Uncharacterized protein n=1 Tax=Setaria viridis TaxID=4556 RepID=A0A4V6D130_SETVI|nr:hypothetical protein SEVIR_9G203400v2 [Setaria viridis]
MTAEGEKGREEKAQEENDGREVKASAVDDGREGRTGGSEGMTGGSEGMTGGRDWRRNADDRSEGGPTGETDCGGTGVGGGTGMDGRREEMAEGDLVAGYGRGTERGMREGGCGRGRERGKRAGLREMEREEDAGGAAGVKVDLGPLLAHNITF